jgi:hypothetical protein
MTPIAHRNLTILTVPEPRVLDELDALVGLQDYVLARLSPTELIIDPARTGELATRLTERGLHAMVQRARAAG